MNISEAISAKRLFGLVLVLKVFSSLLGWWLNSPWILGFTIPLALMAAYIAIGTLLRDRDEVSDEKFADSCYYLGFIFTITSIIICLLDIRQISSHLNDIAVRFGAAMVSTALGLGIRVYLVNFKKDALDLLETAEDDLLISIRAFQTHLEFVIDRVKAFTAAVNDATSTAIASVNLNIEAVGDACTKHLAEQSETVSQHNRQISEQLAGHLSKVSQNLEISASNYIDALVESIKRIQVRLDEFTSQLHQRLNDVVFPEDYFVSTLQPPVETLATSMSAISREISNSATDFKIGFDKVTHAFGQVSSSADNVSGSIETVNSLVGIQRELVSSIREQAEVVKQLVSSITSLDSSFGETVRSLGRERDGVENMAKQIRDMAAGQEASQTALKDAKDTVNHVVKELTLASDRMNDIMQNFSQLQANCEEIVTLSKDHLVNKTQSSDRAAEIVGVLNGLQKETRDLTTALRDARQAASNWTGIFRRFWR